MGEDSICLKRAVRRDIGPLKDEESSLEMWRRRPGTVYHFTISTKSSLTLTALMTVLNWCNTNHRYSPTDAISIWTLVFYRDVFLFVCCKCLQSAILWVFGQPVVKRFPLYYRTVVLSVLSVCNVDVLWPNGWTDHDATSYAEVGLGPCHIVLDGDPAPPRKGAQQPHLLVGPLCSGTVAHLSNCWALVRCSHDKYVFVSEQNNAIT